MKKMLCIIILLTLTNVCFSKQLTHALFYMFRPQADGPMYSYWLDTKTDTLKVEISSKEVKTISIKLDSITITKIFDNGIQILESISFEKSHYPTISNFYLNLQISHNLKNRTVEISDEYYFMKILSQLKSLNKMIPKDCRLPIERTDFSLRINIEKYTKDTCFKVLQQSVYSKNGKELFYSNRNIDSISFNYFTTKLNRSNIYFSKSSYNVLSMKIINHLNKFSFGKGDVIMNDDYFKTEIWFHYPGINIENRFFSLEEYKKNKLCSDIIKYINSNVLKAHNFE